MTMISATTTNTRCRSIHQQLDESTVAVAAPPSSSSRIRGGRLLQSLFGLSNLQRPLSPPSKEQPHQHGHQDTFCLLDLFNPLRGSEPLSLEQQASLTESLLLLKRGECSSSSSKQPQPPHHRRDESTLFTEEEEEDGYDDDEMDAWNFRYFDPQSPSSQPLQERRVSFQKVVCVVEVPSHRDYSPDLREQLWYSADEMDALVERNTMEYLVEGRDWRRASEEYVFCCHPLTGELLHPATWMKTVFMSSALPHDGESSWPYQERRRRRYKRRTNTRRQRRQRQLLVSSSVWIDNNLFATNVPFYPPPPPPPKLSAEYHLVQHHHQLRISTKMMDNTGNCPAVLLPLSSRQRCCLENAAASSSGNNYYPTTTSSSYYHDRTY